MVEGCRALGLLAVPGGFEALKEAKAIDAVSRCLREHLQDEEMQEVRVRVSVKG